MNVSTRLASSAAVLGLLFASVVAPSAHADTLINVDCAPGNTAINSAIGQTFFPGAATLESIEIWIKPELYYTTTYELRFYDGAFTSLLATSAPLNINSSTSGAPSQFYSFALPPIVLAASQEYSWKLVRLSTYSGAFAPCGNSISGTGYWLGTTPESSGNDYSFRLNGTPLTSAIQSSTWGEVKSLFAE